MTACLHLRNESCAPVDAAASECSRTAAVAGRCGTFAAIAEQARARVADYSQCEQTNATNATDTTVPSPTPLAGTSYSCVSRSEYTAIALDPLLSKESRQYTDGSFFCEGYVDYAAACDLLQPKKSCNNKYAKEMYTAFETALSVFSCKQYSLIWTCRDCKKAYKRWLCSQGDMSALEQIAQSCSRVCGICTYSPNRAMIMIDRI